MLLSMQVKEFIRSELSIGCRRGAVMSMNHETVNLLDVDLRPLVAILFVLNDS